MLDASPLLAHADYVYSFSGETTGGTVDTFTFTSTTLIQSDTVVSLSSCASGGVPCSYAAIYPNGASYVDPGNPTIYYDQMITGPNPGDFYFFDSDAFGQVGVHTTDAFYTSLLVEYATDIDRNGDLDRHQYISRSRTFQPGAARHRSARIPRTY